MATPAVAPALASGSLRQRFGRECRVRREEHFVLWVAEKMEQSDVDAGPS